MKKSTMGTYYEFENLIICWYPDFLPTDYINKCLVDAVEENGAITKIWRGTDVDNI